MGITTSLVLFMVIVIIYMALVWIFSILFRITGLPRSKAFFQTISLLTAVGFTTSESEMITSHPTRRKLAIACMLIGSLLSVVVISLLVDSISSFDIQNLQNNSLLLWIAFGVFVFIIILFNLPFVKKPLGLLIQKIGYYFYSHKNGGNTIIILDSYEDDCIAEIVLNYVPDQLRDKSLFESNIKEQYSINVMFVRRKDVNVQITKDTIIQKNDVIVVFGNKETIETFFSANKISIEEENKLKNKVHNEISIIENYKDEAMVDVVVNILPEELKDKELSDSPLKKQYDINVIILKRNEDIVRVTKNTKIQVGDHLIVFGPYKNIKYLFASNK